eukprot:gene4317-8584_t
MLLSAIVILTVSIGNCRSFLQSKKTRHLIMKKCVRIGMSDDSGNEQNSQPPLIPFDDVTTFSRSASNPKVSETNKKSNQKTENPIIDINLGVWQSSSDDSRPTGYDKKEEDDNWVPAIEENTSPFLEFLKNVYISSPFDSNDKRQAKMVVRSITLLSLVFGIIFTVTWYAFPGSFIHYKANTQFASRYTAALIDPEELLSTEFSESGGVFFDDGEPPMAKTTVDVISSSSMSNVPSPSSSSSTLSSPSVLQMAPGPLTPFSP